LASLTLKNLDFLSPYTLDGFASVIRVDGALTVSNCTNLVNMDGLTASLQTVQSVTILDNPDLCNIDTSQLVLATSTNPILFQNGGMVACSPLVPASPGSLSFENSSLTASSITLTWTLAPQPSVETVITLTSGGTAILTFPVWDQVASPTHCHSWSQGQLTPLR